ncbi:MAG: PAS domain S-box protein [Nitrospirae bacterium]|nr:PAS domain S-box protein [Nitrospirota bacterium]
MSNKTILVIDDEELLRETIRDTLMGEGYNIIEAQNGKEGLELLNEYMPILVVLDLKMPVMDGITFLEKINISTSSAYAVIVLTGHGDEDDVKKCYQLGVSIFLRKPFHVYGFKGLVRHLVEMKILQLNFEIKLQERTIEIKESEEKFKAMFDYSNDGVCFVEPKTKEIILTNKKFREMLGFSADEIIGMTIADIHPKEDLEWIIDKFNKAIEEQISIIENIPVLKKDGVVFIADINSYLSKYAGKFFIVGHFRDVTDRHALQKVLKQHKLLFDYAGYGIFGLDLSGRTTFINPAAAKMIRWEVEELIGKFQHDIIHHSKPDGSLLPKEECQINMSFQQGITTHADDEVFWRKDGTSFPVDYTATPIRNDLGYIEGAVIVFKDITEHKQFEDKLNQSVRYTLNIINSSMDMIIATGPDGRIFEFNISAQQHFQYSKDEILGKSLSNLFSPIETSINVYDETIKRSSFSAETTCVRKDGTQFVTAVSFSIMYGLNGRISGLVGVMRDITEHKKLELKQLLLIEKLNFANDELKRSQEQLVQSEKMASLGQLVAGVAHEINTPIGIALTSASRLITLSNNIQTSINNKSIKKSEFEQYLKDNIQGNNLILRNLNRTADLIRSFKMVSADQTTQEIREFNLRSYIEEIIISLRPNLKKTEHAIAIKCPNNIVIKSNPGAYVQIITNLFMNSMLHAFENDSKGHILISCKQIKNIIILKYRDNGKGIPEENLKKIFDPFFTTKRGTGGTGLGLNIVYNIVNKNLNGTIRCESKVGYGTTFIMELPINLNDEISMRPYKPH